jgi:hypothetical protein
VALTWLFPYPVGGPAALPPPRIIGQQAHHHPTYHIDQLTRNTRLRRGGIHTCSLAGRRDSAPTVGGPAALPAPASSGSRRITTGGRSHSCSALALAASLASAQCSACVYHTAVSSAATAAAAHSAALPRRPVSCRAVLSGDMQSRIYPAGRQGAKQQTASSSAPSHGGLRRKWSWWAHTGGGKVVALKPP